MKPQLNKDYLYNNNNIMKIHKKINFKACYPEIDKHEIIKNGYRVDVTHKLKNVNQLSTEYDVISENPNLFVHKHTKGSYFTYRISDDKNNEFSGFKNCEYAIRAGIFGIKIIHKI